MTAQVSFAGIVLDDIIGHIGLGVQKNLSFFSQLPLLFTPAPLGLNSAAADRRLGLDKDNRVTTAIQTGFKQQGGVQNHR